MVSIRQTSKPIGIGWRTENPLSVSGEYVDLFRDDIWTIKVYKLSIKYICLSFYKILVTMRFNTKLCSDDLSILPVALVFYCIHFLHSISQYRIPSNIWIMQNVQVLLKTNVLFISLYHFLVKAPVAKLIFSQQSYQSKFR